MHCQTSQVFLEYLISNYFLFHRLLQVFYSHRPTCTRLGIHEMAPLQLSMASMNEGKTTSSVFDTVGSFFRFEILCTVHRHRGITGNIIHIPRNLC